MAYDQNGNFYFDPEGDVDDQMALADAERVQKVLEYKQQNAAAKAEQQFMTEGWQEALKDAGIDQETYARLASHDPSFAQGIIKNSMKSLAKSVAQRPRDKDGRFVSSKQPQAVQATQADRKVKQEEIVKNRTGSDDEVLELLNTIISPDDPIYNMG